MSSNCNWTSENDEILINYVRKHEAIYNTKLKQYRKPQLKQKLWSEIGEILNKSETDCCKRWCYIRDYYIRRKAKPGTGITGEAAKKRADLLSFLDAYSPSQRHNMINFVDRNPGDISVKVEITHEEDDVATRDKDVATSNRDVAISNTNVSSDKKRKYYTQENEYPNRSMQIVNQNTNENVIDENDLFFGSMAKIVKKLPPYEQVQLRLQIGSLVGNAELCHVANSSPQMKRPSSRNSDDYYESVPSPISTLTTTSPK